MITDAIEPFIGISCSAGIGIGKIVRIKEKSFNFNGSENRHDSDVETERLKRAILYFHDLNDKLSKRVDSSLGERNGDIIRSHNVIIDDPEMNELFYKFIRSGRSAEEAVSEVCSIFSDMFGRIDDPIVSQKKTDIEDVKQSLLGVLAGDFQGEDEFEEGTVLVGKSIPPSLVSKLENGHVVGIVSESGNAASHSAILAKCLKIPMITGVDNIFNSVYDNDEIIVDAINGIVVIAPDDDEYYFYKKKRKEYLQRQKELEEYKGKDTILPDGSKFAIMCNITGNADVKKVLEADGDGVGLYRTEFLYMNSDSLPTEEEQFATYKKLAEDLEGRPAVIRTLDIGGDKEMPCLELPKEDNPFLGLRGIRLCFREKEILQTQLRAILRASAFGNLSILIPMITDIGELLDFKELVDKIKKELDSEGISYNSDIKIGCMIETPSSVFIAKELAEECDFFSIGTNDLVQYTMCADRGNAGVSYLYSPYFPAVLRMIREVAKSAAGAGIPVSICGEAAAEEKLLPFFIGVGIKGLSVTTDMVLQIKKAFASIEPGSTEKIAKKVLGMTREHEIMSYLREKL